MLKNSTIPQEAPEQQHTTAVARSGRAANQNTLRNISLIVKREYKNRVTQRSFIISTIVMLFLIIIGACVPTIIAYFASTSNTQTKIAVVNNANTIAGLHGDALSQYIQANLNGTAGTQATSATTSGQSTSSGQPHFAVTTGTSDAINSLQQKVKNGNLNILLVLDRTTNQDLRFTYYTNANSTDDANIAQVQTTAGQLNFLDKASRLGLTPAQTGSLFVQPGFTVVNTGQNQDHRSASAQLAGYLVAYAGIILIFMSVFLYGVSVATGVAEEKGSRIMEILVNAATPFQLMTGKIIGIGAAGLTQMACFVIVGIGAFLLQTPLQAALTGHSGGGLSIDIASISTTLLLMLLLYFILGFSLYATLFAAMGALVKRQDEVQNAIQPLTWLFMIGYIASFIGISAPDATWIKVMSYIPFWTPTTMLMRLGAGTVAWWEIPLSIVLMLIATFVCALIAARIYRFGILMYGQKPGLRQLVKMIRMK